MREQLLQAVAMIFKRGTVESNDKDMTTLFKDVEGLIQTGELSLVGLQFHFYFKTLFVVKHLDNSR